MYTPDYEEDTVNYCDKCKVFYSKLHTGCPFCEYAKQVKGKMLQGISPNINIKPKLTLIKGGK